MVVSVIFRGSAGGWGGLVPRVFSILAKLADMSNSVFSIENSFFSIFLTSEFRPVNFDSVWFM